MKTKVNITLDEKNMAELERIARKESVSISFLINKAVSVYIGGHRRILAQELYVIDQKRTTLLQLIEKLKEE